MKRTTKPKAKRKARKVVKSSTTGRYVPKAWAASDPAGTVTETINPPAAVLKAVVIEVKEILAAEELKPKTRVRRAMDRIMAAWHYVGG